jgi:hypothetical protein
MKKLQFSFNILLVLLISLPLMGQKVYNVVCGEMIFSMSEVQFTDAFQSQYPNAEMTRTDIRYTIFFHLGSYWHYDITNHFGFFSGVGIRNVGLITDEQLPDVVGSSKTVDYKIVRRVYSLGIPLALKIGSFSDHFYIFGGGEYEWAYVFKEKYWTNTQNRDGSKTKDIRWFGNQTPSFIPSLFAGIQLPRGINIRFKYYLDDFLNHNYKAHNNGSQFNISDLTRYKTSTVYYISVCWQFKSAELKKVNLKSDQIASK